MAQPIMIDKNHGKLYIRLRRAIPHWYTLIEFWFEISFIHSLSLTYLLVAPSLRLVVNVSNNTDAYIIPWCGYPNFNQNWSEIKDINFSTNLRDLHNIKTIEAGYF